MDYRKSCEEISILDPKKYKEFNDNGRFNGQINLFAPQDPNVVFKMQERINIRNKSTAYGSAMSGNDWECNPLSDAYFSAANIQILQNGLRAGVYHMSGEKQIVVPQQNVDQLKIIMRSIYMQYARHHLDDIRNEIARLNKLVLDYAVPAVYGEAIGYLKYLEDKSTIVMPLARPMQSDRDFKQLEQKPWFGLQIPRVESEYQYADRANHMEWKM